MKRLTREEAEQIKKKPDGRGSLARGILITMGIGEIILLERKDWGRKAQTPKTYCLQLGRKTGMRWKCEVALDGSGWIVERVG